MYLIVRPLSFKEMIQISSTSSVALTIPFGFQSTYKSMVCLSMGVYTISRPLLRSTLDAYHFMYVRP